MLLKRRLVERDTSIQLLQDTVQLANCLVLPADLRDLLANIHD